LKYVSIRHGGFSISGVEGDEINGLTLGAVGSGTTIEYVEVYANFDDCFEWFGGTVEAKHLVGAFCGDDSFDYDQGFRGKGQFWFSIHDTDTAGRGGEHDGGDSGGDDATPFSIPYISNVTYIGSGASALVAGGDGNDRTFAIRDNAGGKYYNSIFTDYPGVALNIEDLASGEDSRARLEAGDLVFNNNIWFGYGAGSTLDAIVDGDFAESIIAANANQITDPQLASISRAFGGFGLDPRPAVGSPALSGAVSVSSISGSGFFEDVAYYGAFGAELWIQDWTALSANGFLGLISEVAVEPVGGEIPDGYALEQNYPNPFNPTTTIEFSMAETQRVQLSVFDMLGRRVATLVDGVQPAGSYRVTFDAAEFASGMYIYRIETANAVLTRSMTLLK
ncbi:MAG: T9SS type A sorting domain-containing protein, partial [Rhodothermia bacterium]|nr:T9SS type A sorting domain-containing protein [Rhodothermia bacterium]